MSSIAEHEPNGWDRSELEDAVERIDLDHAPEGHCTLTPALLALGLRRGRELRSQAFTRALARLFGRR